MNDLWFMKNGLVWRRNVLTNGLRVLYLPKPSANTVQLALAIEYGSNCEDKETAGAAHFLEHMLAGGSENRIYLSRSVESYGGVLNFYTDHEYTMSMMDVLPENLPQTAQVLTQLLFDSSFEQEKFTRERKIILNELAEVSDDPTEKLDELLLKSLFKKHPVRHPIGGYPKTINKLSIDQLSEIHKANYQPQNMILMLIGNLPKQDVESALKFFKGKNELQPKARQIHNIEVFKPNHEVTKKKSGIAQTYLSIGTRTVNSLNPDVPALDLIGMIIGGGTSSRLFIELREKHALTYDVSSIHSKGLDFGYFSVNCAVKSANANKAKEVISKELAKLRTEKVLEEELERNKKMILSGILRGIDNAEECLDILAFMELQFGNEKALINYIEKIKAVTVKDILDAANIYLQEDNFATVTLAPKI